MSTAAATALDYDPDVLQAIEDLGPYAARLRRVEGQLLETDPTLHRHIWMGLRAEGSQCREAIKLRADRLNLHPAALLHMLDEESRLREQLHRKPSRDALRRALATSVGVTERDRKNTRVAAQIARVEADAAERAAEASMAAYRAFEGRAD